MAHPPSPYSGHVNQDNGGATALHYAAANNQAHICEALLGTEAFAEVDLQ